MPTQHCFFIDQVATLSANKISIISVFNRMICSRVGKLYSRSATCNICIKYSCFVWSSFVFLYLDWQKRKMKNFKIVYQEVELLYNLSLDQWKKSHNELMNFVRYSLMSPDIEIQNESFNSSLCVKNEKYQTISVSPSILSNDRHIFIWIESKSWIRFQICILFTCQNAVCDLIHCIFIVWSRVNGWNWMQFICRIHWSDSDHFFSNAAVENR